MKGRQLNLIDDEPVGPPLKWGPRHYVPILKSLPGEISALEHAAPDTWDRMTPLIEGVGKTADSSDTRSTLPSLAKRLVPAVRRHQFYLDFPALATGARLNVGSTGKRRSVNALEHLFDEALAVGLRFIPVARPSDPVRRLELLRDLISQEGRGGCIRLRLTATVWERGPAEALAGLLDALKAEPESIDLLLDLGFLGPAPGFQARHLITALRAVPTIESWRGLILAGTVIPASAAGWPEGGITELTRHEWNLWQELGNLDVPRMPSFGDYAVQHPTPPKASGPGMRANIRYTTADAVLYARGHSILEHGAPQYADLSQMLTSRSEFRGSSFSWGDEVIANTAAGKLPPGGEPRWRGAGTSHHLTLVSRSLAN